MKKLLAAIFSFLLFFLFPSFVFANTTIYFPNFEKDLEKNKITKYYSLPNLSIQKVGDAKFYSISDHLSSTRVIVSNSQSQYLSYYPYGSFYIKPQNSNITNLYTSQKLDSITSLYYYHARYYNPTTSHFISADYAKSFNRYSYVQNNPINNTDPTGNMVDEGGMGSSTLYGGYGLGYYSQSQAEKAIEASGQVVKTGSMFIPGVGPYFMAGIGGYEAFAGKDLISREKLSPLSRVLRGLGMLPAASRLGKLAIEAEMKLSPSINSFYGRQVVKKYGMHFSKNPAEFYETNFDIFKARYNIPLEIDLMPPSPKGISRYWFSYTREGNPIVVIPGIITEEGEFLTPPFRTMYHEFTHAFQYGPVMNLGRNPFRYLLRELEANAVGSIFAPQPVSATVASSFASLMTSYPRPSFVSRNLFLVKKYNRILDWLTNYGCFGQK